MAFAWADGTLTEDIVAVVVGIGFPCIGLDDILAKRSRDGQPTFTRLGVDGGTKDGEPLAVVEADDAESFVFNTVLHAVRAFFRPETTVVEAGDFRHLAVEQLEGIFEQMRAPVVHDTAGDAERRAPPVALRAVAAHVSFDFNDIADDFFLADEIDGAEDPAVPMAVVVGGEHDAVAVASGDHVVAFLRGDRERFFRDDVEAAVHALDGEFRMGVVRRGDADEIDVAVFQHGGDGIVCFDFGEVFFRSDEARFVDVGDACERHACTFHFVQMLSGDHERRAVTDGTDLDVRNLLEFFHVLLRFCVVVMKL